MCTKKQSFANTGLVTISSPNPNLNGTGVMGTVLTAGLSGTNIDQITIKSQGNTSEGMIRLFIDNAGSNTLLYKEIYVPASIQTAVEKSFEFTLKEQITLNPGYTLKASTQNADTFNISANGSNWFQCDCVNGSDCDDLRNFARTEIKQVNTGNSNLNGTGPTVTLFTAQSGALNGGGVIEAINIKSTGNTSEGMIRLFIDNGTTKFLITEMQIPATTQSSVQPAFRSMATLQIYLQPGYSLVASTQVSDTFNILVKGHEVINCAC
ncbi:MAG: hypothetical protein JST70_11930 [Bacteroidetes bacterium]|nr:hypothetical protein [Bacteroidota bacterium]